MIKTFVTETSFEGTDEEASKALTKTYPSFIIQKRCECKDKGIKVRHIDKQLDDIIRYPYSDDFVCLGCQMLYAVSLKEKV